MNVAKGGMWIRPVLVSARQPVNMQQTWRPSEPAAGTICTSTTYDNARSTQP